MEALDTRHRLQTNLLPARHLVANFPDRAAELIARACDLNEIEVHITLGQGQRKSYYGGGNEYSALEPPFETCSAHSQRSESPPTTRFARPRGKPPPSPPTSSSSKSKSKTEYVFVAVGEPIQERRLSVKNASINFSVIRADIVYNRLRENVEPTDQTSTPYDGVPTGALMSNCKTLLTWRRPESDRTHETTFHLVPNQAIDSDILLCDLDSGEGERINPAEPQSPTPLRTGPNVPFIPPPVPEAPDARSHHRSSLYGDDPVAHIAQRQAAHRSGLPDLTEHPEAEKLAEAVAYRQHSPNLAQMPGFTPSSGGHQQLRGQSTAGSSSPLYRSHQQTTASDELRVDFRWDKALRQFNVALHPATGEVLFNMLKREFQRLNNVDRAVHEILFTQEKSGDEGDGMILSLDQDNLETDWESAVDWMKENKRERKPHLYAIIRCR